MAVKLRKKTKKLRRKELERLAVALMAVLLLLLIPLFFWKCSGDAPHSGNTPETFTLPPASSLEPNPYGVADFCYKDGYLSLKDGSSILGIDVSSHQGEIDWQQVADAGVRFVLIRVAYRGYGNGALVADELAQQNYAGAKAAGLQVGAYIFSQAISVEEAREEAAFFLEQTAGWQLDMPVVFDWEFISADISKDARTNGMDGATLTACTLAFCREMEHNGLMPMVYFNLHLARDYLDLEQLQSYRFWLALYSDEMTYPNKVDFWQYTKSGRIPGIETDVDINLLLP